MRAVAVVPFHAPLEDADAGDLAAMIARDTAGELMVAGVIESQLLLDDAEPSEAAAALGVDAALGAMVRVDGEELTVAALLGDAEGNARAEWEEQLPVGQATQLGRLIARAVLLALGEDASAPPAELDAPLPVETVMRLARARRRLADDPRRGVEELVALAPEVPAASKALIAAAREAEGSDRMPIFYAALERLLEARPEELEVLFAAGDYRALHFEENGARELFLAARERAPDQRTEAQALERLAALAEQAGREDEAIAHLRNGIRLADDAGLLRRLGRLLLKRDPVEGLRMLTRATVLAPSDAELHLELLAALRAHGAPAERVLAVATHAARLCEGRPDLEQRARAELEAVLQT